MDLYFSTLFYSQILIVAMFPHGLDCQPGNMSQWPGDGDRAGLGEVAEGEEESTC